MAPRKTQSEKEEGLIDFGKYMATLVRQWKWILGCALGLGVLIFVIALLIDLATPTYTASAVVASSQTLTSVNFGGAISTQNQTDLAAAAAAGAQYLYDRTARLASFVALVNNGTVAQQVLDQLGPELKDKKSGKMLTAMKLLGMVNGQMVPKTDSIQISASYRDPIIATDIANTWAQDYVQQINDLYGNTSGGVSPASIESQIAKAKTDYETADKILSDFIATDKSDEYQRQIDEITVVIKSLRDARSTAVGTIVNAQTKSTQDLIQELYADQSNNQILAIKADQDERRQLVLAYMDAISKSRQDVFNQQAQDLLTQLDQAYTNRRSAVQFLNDATSMLNAVKTGGDAAAVSNAVALTLLKAQIYASFQGTNNLQIQQLPESWGSSVASVDAAGMTIDLNALISALQTQQTSLDKQIATLSAEIQAGQDYKFLDTSLVSTGELAQQVQARYPELFSAAGISGLSLSVSQTNPLVQAAVSDSQDLLQLKGLGDVINVSVAGTPIETKIEDLEQQVRDLNSQISIQASKKQELQRESDLAWQTYSALSTKGTEVAVASQTTGSEVVFASAAVPPSLQSVYISSIKIGAIAIAIGLLFGVVIAYAYEFWQNYNRRRIEDLSQKIFADAKVLVSKSVTILRKKSR